MDWLEDDLAGLRQRDLYRRRRYIQSAPWGHVHYRGRELLNFASNDYLNLAADSRLARAAARAAHRYGTGAGASPLVSGYLPPHRALERALARWEEADAALVFPSGFAANLAVIAALASPEDAVFSDELNHASLIDGCRLARAAIHVYRHADAGHLETLLKREGRTARRRLIVSETVFSMDGDQAPLAELLDLATRHECLLVLDEAHATGVLGAQGRGLGAVARHVVKVGTLSKALGAQGGFISATRPLIDYLVNHARPYIFSTALAPPIAAAACRAVAIAAKADAARRHLQLLGDLLRTELQAAGIGENRSQSPIVPVIVGDARRALDLSARLEAQGLLVPAIRPPSVPVGTARLRISLTAGHSAADVHRLVGALREARTATMTPT
ncbi:MAG: 8-amino-7-oxononanoate synthase [Gemmataceae bacterium]|nr:8-amino-7-oxononanoate synthase [Gemmataceae bacterium]